MLVHATKMNNFEVSVIMKLAKYILAIVCFSDIDVDIKYIEINNGQTILKYKI